jgi:hypothetical protein
MTTPSPPTPPAALERSRTLRQGLLPDADTLDAEPIWEEDEPTEIIRKRTGLASHSELMMTALLAFASVMTTVQIAGVWLIQGTLPAGSLAAAPVAALLWLITFWRISQTVRRSS